MKLSQKSKSMNYFCQSNNQSELQKIGLKNKWEKVAQILKDRGISRVPRPAKQCRERWVNKVDPDIDKGDWNDQDDLQLVYKLLEKGKKWAEIRRELRKKRTEFSIRQRFHFLTSKYKKLFEKEKQITKSLIYQIKEQLLKQNLVDCCWSREQILSLMFIAYKIEQSGGDSKTKNESEQLKQNAMFKPLDEEIIMKKNKKLQLAIVNPKKHTIIVLNPNILHHPPQPIMAPQFLRTYSMPIPQMMPPVFFKNFSL